MANFFKTLLMMISSLIISIFVLIVVVTAAIAGAATYFAPSIEAPKQGSVLELNLCEQITDSPRNLPIINMRKLAIEESSPLSLLSVMRALETAAADPNITALSLRMDGEHTLSLATAEELRDAIVRFKASSGKPVYSYSQSYSQSSYYLASVADSIFLEPLGCVEWQGIAMAGYYFGDLLKSLEVGVEVFRPTECRYKSAVEPYILSEQSPESREQSQRLVDELWRGVVGEISEARNIPVDELRSAAKDLIIVESEEAHKRGFVDRIGYYDEYEAALEKVGIMRKSGGKLRRMTLANYSLLQQQNSLLTDQTGVLGGAKIGVVYADGVIIDGKSEGGNDPAVGSQTLCAMLRKAREDDQIKAVVLRVNSPGGSALAADVMWREVELLREVKPVIVSMGSYAASGGYYISAPADMILADRYTLTGSIGVYSVLFNYEQALKNGLGINIDGVGSEPSAQFGRRPRQLNAKERAAMMRSVDEVYESFTDKVATGRNLPIGVVQNIAGGKVWSGVEAEASSLVDGIGGLHKALTLAIDRSSLSGGEYSVVEIEEDRSGLDMLLTSMGMQVAEIFGMEGTTKAMRQLKRIESAQRGMIMHAPERLQ